MRRLILMRHAKSDWAFSEPDHDRPLNARGQRAAPALGAWLVAQGVYPDQALCSTATRTRETLAGTGLGVTTQFDEALYHAAPDTLIERLRQARGETVLLVGHNPGIADAASQIVATPPDHPRFVEYPTGATLVVSLNIDTWRALAPGQAQVLNFVVPRDLVA